MAESSEFPLHWLSFSGIPSSEFLRRQRELCRQRELRRQRELCRQRGLEEIKEHRVVLLGNVGSGKSTSGNTLLGSSHFDCKLSACPVTKQCEVETEIRRGRRITVVDTPGLTAETVTDTKEKKKLLQCLQLSIPGPHVFLLVIPLGRFTQEEKDTVQRAAQLFKEHFYNFTIILFTFKDNLKNGSISDYISTAGESLQLLVQKCGNRYHAFNNNNPSEDDQAEQLFVIMDSLVQDNDGRCYMLKECRFPFSEICDLERERQNMLDHGIPSSVIHHRLIHHIGFPFHWHHPFDSDSDEEDDVCSEVDLKEEFDKLKICGVTEENLKKQAEILEKWKEQLESREKQLNDREEQIRKQEGEMEEKKTKLKEHLLKLSEDL